MEMPLFIKRLQGYAVEAGAQILFETEFAGLLLEEGRPAGINARTAGEELTIKAPLVISPGQPAGPARRGD